MLDLFFNVFSWSNLWFGLKCYLGVGVILYIAMYFASFRDKWRYERRSWLKKILQGVAFILIWLVISPIIYPKLRSFVVRKYWDVWHYVWRKKQAAKNEKLRKARLEWMCQHPITLCYTVMNGVVAVMREEEYDREVEKRKRFRDDGLADEKTLIPLSKFVICFTAETVKNRNDIPSKWWISGSLDDFDALRGVVAVKLKKVEDITVPFASKKRSTFQHQLELLGTRLPTGKDRNLIKEANGYLLDFKFPDNLKQ